MHAEVRMADGQELVKAGEGGGPQHVLVPHALLTGLTPLSPVPLLDDLVKIYFRKRLVRSLAAAAGRTLTDEELEALASEAEGGGLRGSAMPVLVYPLKNLSPKIFFFLEGKPPVDLTSRTYPFGYLVGHALRRREG